MFCHSKVGETLRWTGRAVLGQVIERRFVLVAYLPSPGCSKSAPVVRPSALHDTFETTTSLESYTEVTTRMDTYLGAYSSREVSRAINRSRLLPGRKSPTDRPTDRPTPAGQPSTPSTPQRQDTASAVVLQQGLTQITQQSL